MQPLLDNLVKSVVLQKSHPLTSTTKQKPSYQKAATSKRTSLILIHQRTTNYCLFQFLCKTKLVQQVQTIISYPISPHFSKVIITYIGNLWKKKPPLHFLVYAPSSIRPLVKIAFRFFISAKTPPLIHCSLQISYLRYLITLFYTALFCNTKYNIIYEFT